MAQSLDLEEQEQLAQIKHFWSRYGNVITWGLIVVFGALAAWNGWNYWQRKQAMGASALYDEIERAASDQDAQRLERAWTDIKDKFGSTAFAHQAALLAASGLNKASKLDQAKAALVWAAEQGSDEGLQAVARLRLAALALEAKSPDQAEKWLGAPMPAEFAGLVADRQGDVYMAQARKAEARTAYEKAYQLLEPKAEYRQLVEVKLNALGVDPKAGTTSVKPSVSGK